MTGSLLAATAVVDVTPPPGHPLAGYVARRGVANGTADPLQATLLWLTSDGLADPGVLWLSVDAMAVDTALADELAAAAAFAAGIPADRVLVCASHSHSAPSGWSGTVHPVIPAERDPDLERALADAVATADLQAVPVELSWHTADVTGVGTNRYHPGGPHHRTAGILALRAAGDRLLAVLLDFACHPTVLGPANLSWSADWPGAARRAVATATGARVGFLQGAAGDVSPRFTRQARDTTEVARLGNLLGTAVLEALGKPGTPVTAVPAIRRATVTLPVRPLPAPTQIEAAITRALPATAAVRGAESPQDRIATTRLEGARGQAAMQAAGLPGTLDLPLSVVALGDLAWVHLPVELFSTLGERIRAASPYETTRVIGYTDGYFGYVVDPPAAHNEVYEALISYFDTTGTDALVHAATTLLHTTATGT